MDYAIHPSSTSLFMFFNPLYLKVTSWNIDKVIYEAEQNPVSAHSNGLVQKKRNSSALAMPLLTHWSYVFFALNHLYVPSFDTF